MDKTQREYILREQLKAIQRELGEDDPQQAEVNELREKVEQARACPRRSRRARIKEVDRMSRIPSASPEVGVIRTYVDWLISLPWNVTTDDNLDIKAGRRSSSTRTTTASRRSRSASSSTSRCARLADKIRSPILALRRTARRRQDVARQVASRARWAASSCA